MKKILILQQNILNINENKNLMIVLDLIGDDEIEAKFIFSKHRLCDDLTYITIRKYYMLERNINILKYNQLRHILLASSLEYPERIRVVSVQL